jgi:hypothetical protein
MARELDAETISILRANRKPVEDLRRVPTPQGITTLFGTPGVQVYEDPSLSGTGTAGYVPASFVPVDAMFVRPISGHEGARREHVVAHENEHLMARRQLHRPSMVNTLFDDMAGAKSNALRTQFVKDASKIYPYLEKKFGLNSMYFQPEMLEYQGARAPNLVYEQLAELAAIEANTGVDLTKDPYLRKNLFKNREVREIYNALTGLRQTRLDSKDLAPHTRQKETGSSLFSDIKEKVMPKRFNKGGLVDMPIPGGKKLI